MNETYTLPQKIKQMLIILIPLLITQLAMFAMSFLDTAMSGQVSPNDLAGIAIGASLWSPVQMGITGILMAVTPIAAQLIGANRKKEVMPTVVQSIFLALFMSVLVIAAGMIALAPVLNAMPLESEVRMIAWQYLTMIALGIPPLFVYNVLRCFIDALGQTRVTMIITLLSLPINGIFNYLFIFGKLGFPAMGGVGAGIATSITYWILLGLAVSFIRRSDQMTVYRLTAGKLRVRVRDWKELLRIGVPIGMAIFIESSIFAVVTLFMSAYDTVTIAAHQAAINFASFLYMIPMSISYSLAILVGFEVGAGRTRDARQYSFLGIGMGLGMALIFSVLLLSYNTELAAIYTRDAAVLEMTAHFLIYAIFFQLSDAVAAPIQGALRGYKDVNVTFLLALISYWLIGLPLGIALARLTDLGAFGYWVGLITGLAAGAVGLFGRLLYLQSKPARLVSEADKTVYPAP
ncbi:MATE family efflux transporter [Paenibacillus sambharensis]|uniref:Probable multidrug resistance protein NorM n=1 Tax=Paenibacillus sambharensis TaxID=1803190 RepID=A0A2W1LJC4_9BACL|nr:MATE family efflux transporter [Paenibacillus sambharensis]PZD94644.1 MATE family efflux transporter [Paenibacillus sambharensis]